MSPASAAAGSLAPSPGVFPQALHSRRKRSRNGRASAPENDAIPPIPHPQTIRHPERSGARHGRGPRSRRTCIVALSITRDPSPRRSRARRRRRAFGPAIFSIPKPRARTRRSATHHAPEAQRSNSPALQCWESNKKGGVPEGRRDPPINRRPVSPHDSTPHGQSSERQALHPGATPRPANNSLRERPCIRARLHSPRKDT